MAPLEMIDLCSAIGGAEIPFSSAHLVILLRLTKVPGFVPSSRLILPGLCIPADIENDVSSPPVENDVSRAIVLSEDAPELSCLTPPFSLSNARLLLIDFRNGLSVSMKIYW